MWQDYVIMAVQVSFVIFLMPTVTSSADKPPLVTSIGTTIAIVIFVYTVCTLELWFTAIAMATNGVQWAVLAYQRRKIDRKPA